MGRLWSSDRMSMGISAPIVEKRCPAKRCVALLKFTVNLDVCTRCGLCSRACPVEAIAWKKKEVAWIDKDKCIKCMTCFEKCKEPYFNPMMNWYFP